MPLSSPLKSVLLAGSALALVALACGGNSTPEVPTLIAGNPTNTTVAPTTAPTGPTPTVDPAVPTGNNALGLTADQLGTSTALALDENGDPLIAYIVRNPNQDGDWSDAALNFTRWDSTQANWTAPATIATTGQPELDASHQLAMTYDAAQGVLGVLYFAQDGLAYLTISTDLGASWATEAVTGAQDEFLGAIHSGRLAFGNGQTYLAFSGFDYAATMLLSRNGNGGPFTVEVPPLTAGMGGIMPAPAGLALAADGTPMLTYWQWPTDANAAPHTLALWRQGEPTARVIADNRQQSNEGLASSIAINGPHQLVTFNGNPDGANHTLWYLASNDGGATWSEPAKLPQDGEEYPNYPNAVVVNATGAAALTYDFAFGNVDSSRCGRPKLVRATADLQNWSVCSPDSNRTLTAQADIWNSTLALNADGKVWMLFINRANSDTLASGLWLWRDP